MGARVTGAVGGMTLSAVLAGCWIWYTVNSQPGVPDSASMGRQPQMAGLSCGPAALMAVAYARDTRIAAKLGEVLEHDRAVRRPLTSLYDLAALGRQAGLDLVGLRVEARKLSHLPLPAIVHVEPGHFLPLLAVDDDQVLVVKQGGVTHAIPRRGFDRRFTGYVLCLRGPPTEPPESS